MASPSMEWLTDHYYLDDPSSSARKQKTVVPAMEVATDYAEISYHGLNHNSTIISTPSHAKKQSPSSKQRQRYSKAEEPLSPVYVKQQQHRDDNNDPAIPEHRRKPMMSPRPSASNSVIQAFDTLQADRQKKSPVYGKRKGKHHHRQQHFDGNHSTGGSVATGISSSVISHDFASNHLHHNKPALSMVLSDVTELTTVVHRHSILELCTEDLMSDDAQTVACALERLMGICGEGIQFTQCGGHAVLVGVMKKFSSHAKILIFACRLVEKLVSPRHVSGESSDRSKSEHSTGNSENAFAALFLAVNGVECILNLMEHAHPTEDGDSVAVHAVGALTQLLHTSSTAVERFLQSKHAITYLRIVREHRLSTNGTLCRLLYQISTKEDHRGTAGTVLYQGAKRAVDLIVAELNECPDSRSVQVYGCATLANIFKRTPEYGNDGIPAILRSMKLFGNDEIVLERAITGLFYCCKLPRHVDILKLQSGGLSTVSLALECFPKNNVIQSRGSEIIKLLLS